MNCSRLTWIYYSFLQLVIADPIPDLPSASGEAAEGEEEKQRRSRNDVHRGTGTGGGGGGKEARRRLGNSGASLGKRRGARRNAVPSGDIHGTRARPCVAVSSILYEKTLSPSPSPLFFYDPKKITRDLAIIGRNKKAGKETKSVQAAKNLK